MSVIDIETARKPTETFCFKCRHFRNEGPIWYSQFCGHPATQAPNERDPVTGKLGYRRQNDLGNDYFSDRPEPYARDVNKGSCRHFDPAPTSRQNPA